MKKINRDIFYWFTWVILLIFWNFGYPNAKPISDVLVAIMLSIIFILIKKKNKRGAHRLNRIAELSSLP